MGLIMDDAALTDSIKRAIEDIRIDIKRDGGDIELVKIEQSKVFIRLAGACVGCPSAIYTLKFGVEQRLKAIAPQISEIIAVD